MAQKKKTSAPLAAQTDPRAPLDGAAFLAAAQRTVATLRDDLLARADESPGVAAALRAQWQAEREAKRTGDEWDIWRRRIVVQVAAAWVLSLVFARTLEDRDLVERNRIAGPGATDSQDQFRTLAPYLTDRDYLVTVFRELANLPAAGDLFDPAHNPVWKLGPSIEGARALLDLFRAPDPETPCFRFGQADTRFLGDLYQDLDEETRERFALLQTPAFVEKYILDRTLERAIERFGLDDTTLIDPTCGSGHFLLGAFERLVDHRLRKEPGLDVREAARRTLDAVYGADINPFAVAIARFRLTLAFLAKGGYRRLAEAPALPLHLAGADSLLHNPQHEQSKLGELAGQSMHAWGGNEFALEDEGAARNVLHRRFAAVVGNPPYITPKDPILRERYAREYPRSAHRKYSLGAPFTERFFQLARAGGCVGMITANSFMRREFGKKLIEEFLPTVNLDGVVNTSGAYIPGHGTPTVLLFGTNEPKQGTAVLTVLAKRGEPSTPGDPARGQVWASIVDHGGEDGFENDYISVARVPRKTLEKHPWSLGGGGAAELQAVLEGRASARLSTLVESIGVDTITRASELFELDGATYARLGVEREWLRPHLVGEEIRDWSALAGTLIPVPYDEHLQLRQVGPATGLARFLWPHRVWLARRWISGGTRMSDVGLPHWALPQFPVDKHRTPLSIAFAFVATHNHFVLDRGGKVFKQSAPIIKLKDGATEEDHLALLAYLNSSTACFWMKQVFYPKGGHSEARPEKGIADENRYEFAGTGLQSLPVPAVPDATLTRLGRSMESLARQRAETQPEVVLRAFTGTTAAQLDAEVRRKKEAEQDTLRRMVAVQDDLDWYVYTLFGFEVGSAAKEMTAGAQLSTYQRPFQTADCPLKGADAVIWNDRRTAATSDASLTLMEDAVFKRKWWGARGVFASKVATYEENAADTCACLVAERLETAGCKRMEPASAIEIERDAGSGLTGYVDYLRSVGVQDRVGDILMRNAVPYLAAYRYTEAGLEKRREWGRVWDLQRAEDRGETVPPFDPPPQYDQKDYRDATFWRLRGKLDVPEERFISYPGCESDEDKEPVYGWAGWNHLQQAIALATLYMKRKQGEAWGKEGLIPMLAGLDELLPWVWQWHPEPTLESGGMKPGQYIADFLAAQCHELGVTVRELRAWRPESGRKKAASPAKTRTSKKAAVVGEEEAP